MIGSTFIDYLQRFHAPTHVGVEDFSDRFSFLFTVIILLICSSVVTVKQYLLKPIACYISAPIGGSGLAAYVENFCWVHGTNPLSLRSRLPARRRAWDDLEDQKLVYYQWVPFVLGLQAILFYMPRVIWQMLTYNRTGTDLQRLVVSANEAASADTEHRTKMISHIATSLELMLFQSRDNRTGPLANIRRKIHSICAFFLISKRLGTWLIMSYLFIKLLYVGNAVGQMFLMQRFLGLGQNYTFFGMDIARNIIAGKDWQQTMVFPRVTFCRVLVKNVGHVNSVTAQCVLPVNMLNEKIYIFLWFWIILAVVLSLVSVPIWFVRIYFQKNRSGFIRKYLCLSERISSSRKDRRLLDKFVRKFLRHDGVFLLQMISLNAGELVVADIISQLWTIFKLKYRNRDLTDDPGMETATNIQLANLTRRMPSAPEGMLSDTAEKEEEEEEDEDTAKIC